jgi:cellulose synthase (UDP-forming)
VLVRFATYAAVILCGLLLVQQFDSTDFYDFWINNWSDIKEGLSLKNLDDSWQTLLLPAIVTLAVIVALRLLFLESQDWLKRFASGLIIFLSLRYMLWRTFFTLNLSDPINGSLSLLFFVIEVLAFIQNIGSIMLICFSTDRSEQADKASRAVIEEDYLPSVDVLIPTYNEPTALLRRTIIGCQAMDYDNKQVYLLDDQRRPEMRSLAEELGCFYMTRHDNRHAKAGNINHALQSLQGDLITVFDADFVPTQNFLHRTVGFFQNPLVALVQTPQTFYNSDPVRYNLGLEGVLTNEQDFFFRAIQPGRDAINAVICCGTSFVLRRTILNEIGGIPTETLCEDLCTSLKIQSRGYQVLYLNEALSAGASAETISSFIDQRLRWAQGTLQTLFSSCNPFTIPGLDLKQRFFFLLGIFCWILLSLHIVTLLLPLAYLLFGVIPLKATINELLFYWLPSYAGSVILFALLANRKRSFFWTEIYSIVTCFSIAFVTFKTLIKPFGKRFKVTPKGLSASGIKFNWRISFPIVMLVGLYMVAIIRHILNWNLAIANDAVVINLVWTGYGAILSLIALQSTIDVPQEMLSLRFPHELRCQVYLNRNQCVEAETVELSEHGAVVQMHSGLKLAMNQSFAYLDLPQVHLHHVPVQVKPLTTEHSILELEFVGLTLQQERQLIQFLFCQPGQWREEFISERKSFRSFLWSVFRLYPLAET